MVKLKNLETSLIFCNVYDIIFWGIIFFILIIYFLFYGDNNAERVAIKTPQHTYIFPINKDRAIHIDDLPYPVDVRIYKNKVYIEHTKCPLKICKEIGAIHFVGDSIICVPNRLIIKIEGRETIDAITY